MSKRLLELARVRTETVTIAGEDVIVREASALEQIEYRELLNPPLEKGQKRSRAAEKRDMANAVTYLIETCVLDQQGEPSWTHDEAVVIARGRSQVWEPLVTALTGFMGREKKVDLPPPSDSTTV